MDTEIGKKILKSGVKLSYDYLTYLAIYFLEELHRKDSFWTPFLDVYPKLADNFPLFYTEEEKKLLAGSPILDYIKKEAEDLALEISEISAAVPEFKKYSMDEYMRMSTLISSRVYGEKINGVGDTLVVPLADMFNHINEKIGETERGYVDSEEGFVIKANKEISAGDAICISYRRKANIIFLCNYGFVVDDNKSDYFSFNFYLNEGDPQKAVKERMLGINPGEPAGELWFYEDFYRCHIPRVLTSCI